MCGPEEAGSAPGAPRPRLPCPEALALRGPRMSGGRRGAVSKREQVPDGRAGGSSRTRMVRDQAQAGRRAGPILGSRAASSEAYCSLAVVFPRPGVAEQTVTLFSDRCGESVVERTCGCIWCIWCTRVHVWRAVERDLHDGGSTGHLCGGRDQRNVRSRAAARDSRCSKPSSAGLARCMLLIQLFCARGILPGQVSVCRGGGSGGEGVGFNAHI